MFPKIMIKPFGITIVDEKNTYNIRKPFFSLRKYRHLRGRSNITGFVGPRGSGKSVGASRMIILDYMLRGYDVWSNMEIGVDLITPKGIKELRSKEIDKMELVDLAEVYKKGVIYFDEVNMDVAEARRSMSTKNLMFSYILQQIRKRQLSIVWSAQSEMHTEERLRFQTGIFIVCQDLAIENPKCGIGELSQWKVHDYTGAKEKGNTLLATEKIWNKPWFNTYDSWQLQGMDEHGPAKTTDDVELNKMVGAMAGFIKEEGKILKDKVWAKWGIGDENTRRKIVRQLTAEFGIITTASRTKFVYEDN